MKNIDLVAKIFFQGISAYNILKGDITYDAFPKRDYESLALNEMIHLSESETNEIYQYLSECKERGKENGLNVFHFLKKISSEIIFIRDNQPKCHYEELLRWRRITRWLGEDLPVCAFLAQRTDISGEEWNDFEWDTVIGHDNIQLNRIMQKGISDNHFHLFGAAPSFQLIWIKLMNNVLSSRYSKALDEIELKHRRIINQYASYVKEGSLSEMHLQAAIIRAYLVYTLRLLECCDNSEEDEDIFKSINRVKQLVLDKDYRKIYIQQIQIQIQGMHRMAVAQSKDNLYDYALVNYLGENMKHDFEGERSLIYHMLCGRIGNKVFSDNLLNLFYAYIVIKCKFYEELVQVNETIGFQNFNEYNRRKGGFLNTVYDQKKMIQHAVIGSLESGNVNSLEMRITPQIIAENNQRMIQIYDSYLGEYLDEKTIKEKTYYVIHFPKEKDTLSDDLFGWLDECRHFRLRKKLSVYGTSFIKFREHSLEEASRILGIDACAQEIGCRPEVFSVVFRRLSSHVVNMPNFCRVMQLKITYHVGEDFLDMTDGLRAIDEAIRFFDMKNGDRLGHATVLGLDVRKWYKFKNGTVVLKKQDYLDNVVWLYNKLIQYDISGCESLKGYLGQEFEKIFNEIYGQFLDYDFLRDLHVSAQKRARNIDRTLIQGILHFNIDTYFDAWKLRGDDPVLYKYGYYENDYDYFQPYMKNDSVENLEKIRKRVETAALYFYYHYSVDVRKEGLKEIVLSFPDYYIEGVYKVQKAMQQNISDLGISIETNPSSNYLISSMEEYSDHPISNLFNIGLTIKHEEIDKCAQMHVSINTDDKGVFATSLENEYALMACAMEQKLDENGNRKYRKQMVYDWLDNIRERGNQQSFLRNVKNN